MAESAFSPTWRYNPVKRELQFWHAPAAAVAFQASLLKELEKLPLAPPMMFGEVWQLVGQDHIGAIGGWRNCNHENLIKLPISTR